MSSRRSEAPPPLSAYPRSAGVLLHPTSLEGRGTGDLGDAAYRWVEWLAEAGQSLWQLLPLVAVSEGGSPYNGLSAMAGNPLLLSPERLARDGLLEADVVECPAHGSCFNVRTGAVTGLPARDPVATFRVTVADGEVFVEI